MALAALVALLAFSLYGALVPSAVRCELPGAVGCAGGILGPSVVPAGSGNQWFDVTMYDWGFWIVDSTSGANESSDWTVFEGWTVHINATSLPPDTAVGGTAYHGLGVEINATGQQLLSLAAPVGQWVTASFVAPTTPYYHQHIWCTIQCGPGHGSQQAYILNVVPAVNYPVAAATANVTVGSAPLSVQFSGNGSSGAPPYNYTWSFGDGTPGAFGLSATHTYALGGIYYATLTVTDSKGNPGRTTVTITVLSNAPLEATLAATPAAGVVPFGSSLSAVAHGGTPPYRYTWAFGDGPNTSGANATQHLFTAPGVYAVAVTVVDSVGASTRALTLVTVHPAAGSFNLTALASPVNGTAPVATTLNATASGGTAPYSFTWDFGDGTSGSGASVNHQYNQTGSYEAAVFAADAAGRTAIAFANVDVTLASGGGGGGDGGNDSVPGLSPAAAALSLHLAESPSGGGAPLPIQAAASVEGGTGLSESISWSFGDGTSATGAVAAHTFSAVGTYNLTVTATDSGGNTGSTYLIVRVGTLSMQVVANATVGDSPFSVAAGATITGGSGAYGAVSWTFGDGTSATGGLVTHPYGPNASGSFTISAQTTDSAGAPVSASLTVSLRGPPVAAISIVRGSSSGFPLPVTFTVSVRNGSGSYATQVLWGFGDQSGTRGPTVVTHDYNHTGHFLVTVETNDSTGRVATAQTWVNISVALTLPRGGGSTWIFTGVPDPQDAAFALLGLVAVTGLLFLYRKRTGRRKPGAAAPARPPVRTTPEPGGPARPT